VVSELPIRTDDPTDERAAERAESRFLWPPLLLSILLLWVVPMGTSLGLDESGNWWVIKDGLSKIIERSRIWTGGESVLFNLLVMAARALGGDSDVAMRIPSLAMILVTLFFIYRLGRRFAGPLAAMWSCPVFVIPPDVIYVASTVRSYALALANWLDTGRLRQGTAYTLLATLTLYATPLYGGIFPIHAVYAFSRMRAGTSAIRLPALLAAWAACGLLLVPRALDVMRLYPRRAAHSLLPAPDAYHILASMVPPVLAGAAGLGLLVALVLRRPIAFSTRPWPAEGWVLALWAMAPPGILVLLSLFAGVQLFAPRYYLANAPAVALAAGVLLRALEPVQLRRLIATTIAVSAILVYGIDEGFMRGLHDFRGAVAYVRPHVNPDTPVLLVSGFFESQSLANLQDPVLSEVLIAPFLRYRIPGGPSACRPYLTPRAKPTPSKCYLGSRPVPLASGIRKVRAHLYVANHRARRRCDADHGRGAPRGPARSERIHRHAALQLPQLLCRPHARAPPGGREL
jgi:hypothetical protein